MCPVSRHGFFWVLRGIVHISCRSSCRSWKVVSVLQKSYHGNGSKLFRFQVQTFDGFVTAVPKTKHPSVFVGMVQVCSSTYSLPLSALTDSYQLSLTRFPRYIATKQVCDNIRRVCGDA